MDYVMIWRGPNIQPFLNPIFTAGPDSIVDGIITNSLKNKNIRVSNYNNHLHDIIR